MLYSEEILAQVREANDIVDVVGQHVKLDKKGANYFGLCPFHGEKTASFSVNPRKQICYCFGCHKGGNVINFIMEYEHLNFPEAVKYLADRAGIRLPEVRENREELQKRQLKERLLGIQKEAAYFYHDKLNSPDGESGLKYLLQKRGLSQRTVTHFGLGYAGKIPGELYRYLKEKGFTDQELKESGLVTLEETGAKDKFWNRVMFPIMDINGKVIAFGGRVMGDGLPKYLNSPETKIFEKSSVLYGLNFARRTTESYLLLCEGYMDVIALHQSGFTNAVASLGTAFTESHARLLKRFTDTVILTQDSDTAGMLAKIRSFPILHSAGLKVKILDLGDYKDPDEFIKEKGPDAYRECIQKARNAFLANVDAVKTKYDLSDPAQKTDFLQEVAVMLTIFHDDLERDNYVQAVSREQMIAYTDLKAAVDRRMSGHTPKQFSSNRIPISEKQQVQGSNVTDRRSERAENLLLYWLDSRPELKEKVKLWLSEPDFTKGIRREMAQKLLSENLESFDSAAYLDRIEDEESRKIALEVFSGGKEYSSPEEISDADLSKLLTEAVRTIRDAALERELQLESTDLVHYQALLQERKKLKQLQVQL